MKSLKPNRDKALQRRRRLRPLYLINRNSVLFISGLAGTAHETLLAHAERPTLLILFAAMMGLPAFLSPNWPGNYEEEQHPTRQELEEEIRKVTKELEDE